MAHEIVITLVGLLCTTVSSIVTFFLTRRKYNTEVDAQQIENMEKSFDLYKKMMEETLASQKRAQDTTINSLNEKVASLQKENETLKNQFNQLQNQMINFLMSNNLQELKNNILPISNATSETTEKP